MADLIVALMGMVPVLALILLALPFERLRPAEPQPWLAGRLNLCYALFYAVIQGTLAPLASMAAVWGVNAAGGGWIVLPDGGWGLLAGFIAYTLTLDLLEYGFHRAQHAVPLLWAMHSLHHSDQTLNATSTNRHFWLEYSIKLLTIYPLIGMLFKVNPMILGMYGVLGLYNIVPHMNIRLSFGRWAFLMNSPQYHRLHHSSLPEHYNCNFAALFPVFDVLFGTYRPPRSDEYPPTGLASGEQPAGLLDYVLWPLRHGRRDG